MSNKPAKRNTNVSTKQFFHQDGVRSKFQDMLGEKAQGFMTSVLQCVSNNKHLKKANPTSVYNAAVTAAILDLPVNQNLGFAYILPYKGEAQLQIGYKGFIQLAQRSGLYKTISATEVYEGQIVKENPLTGFEFDWDNQQSNKIIGYVSYFELLNGFSKMFYMSKDEVGEHAKEYSQAYKRNYGPWTDNFKGMALKTVLKLLITKFGPMTVDMQQAAIADQGVVKDADNMEVDYVDNKRTGGDDIGKQIAGDIMGKDENNSQEVKAEKADPKEDEDDFYSPTKDQQDNLLSKADYLIEENQEKLVSFINKDKITRKDWDTWMAHARKAEKKAKKE